MLLTGFNIAHYLLNKNLIDIKELIAGDFTVTTTSYRNNSFIVNGNVAHNSYFIKQVQAFDYEKSETLRTEATCYWLANNEAEYINLKKFLPKYIDYDYINHILIIENLNNYTSLHDLYLTHRKFPAEIAIKQAEMLASYQKNIYETIKGSQSMKLFRKDLPLVFKIAGSKAKYWVNKNSKAEQQMVELINQSEEFQSFMANIKDNWEASSLSHNDIKPLNFLINKDCFDNSNFDLRLIDWETADLGDPCWDVAAVLQSYLYYWIYAEPMEGNPHNESYRKYGFTLPEMRPSIIRFWNEYCRLMELTAEDAENRLYKSTQFCAMKLIHSCFETVYGKTDALQPHSARMLQLSLNILKDPKKSIAEIFGF